MNISPFGRHDQTPMTFARQYAARRTQLGQVVHLSVHDRTSPRFVRIPNTRTLVFKGRSCLTEIPSGADLHYSQEDYVDHSQHPQPKEPRRRIDHATFTFL